MDVEQKKEEARRYRGVSYDARVDRFTAEIYLGGERRWLGSYSTAQDAKAAYDAAAVDRPPRTRQRSESAFAQVYAAFRGEHGGDRTDPPQGAQMVFDGQEFTFQEVTWRKLRGQRFAFYVWTSRCRTCGVEYRTLTPTSVMVAKGITRNCSEHTTKAGPRRAKTKPTSEAVTAAEQVAKVLDGIAMVGKPLPIEEVTRLVDRQIEGGGRMVTAWLTGRWYSNTQLPISLEGDLVHFDAADLL